MLRFAMLKYLPLIALLAACGGEKAAPGKPVPDLGPPTTEPDIGPDFGEPDEGPPTPGQIVVEPQSVTYSDVQLGGMSTATITLSNVGGTPIAVTSVKIIEHQRQGDPEFLPGNNFEESFVIDPGLFRQLDVVYAPNDYDQDSATLEFFTEDLGVVRVRLETVSAYSRLVGPRLLRFGDVNQGATSTERITFFNRGLDALQIDNVELGGISGTFAIAFEPNATPPTVIERDEDFVIDVTYTPDNAETHRGTVTIYSNSPATPTLGVALVGNEPTPCIDITPDIADFGEAAPASAVTQQITLLNCSNNLALNVSEVTLIDDGNGAFALQDVPALPLELSPRQTAQLTLTGELAAAGIATGELRVTSDDTTAIGHIPVRLTVPDPSQ